MPNVALTENNAECYHSENEHEVDRLKAGQQGGTVKSKI